MQLYNTLTRQMEKVPDAPKPFRMYVCGPTVYNPIHVGNARAYVTYRFLARYLERRGNKVLHVSNITDINEKIDRRAKEIGISSKSHAYAIEMLYKKHTSMLGLGRPDLEPRASEHLLDMQNMIQKLIDTGHAYVTENGNVYYRAHTAPHPSLSGRDLESARSVRVLRGTDKDSGQDFALWKKDDAKPNYESPWSVGRPGWHIECSAMAHALLGEEFDLHGGGLDLIFPHHEAERSQSVSSGDVHAHIWWHSGLLTVGGEKGSKTAGNLPTLIDALTKWGKDTLLLYYMTAHPRAPLEWNEAALLAAASQAKTISQILWRSGYLPDKEPDLTKMHASLEDDFNLPVMLAQIHKDTADLNQALETKDPDGAQIRANLLASLDVFGLSGLAKMPEVPSSVAELAQKRLAARETKNWQKADKLREEIFDLGWQILDQGNNYTLLPK